MLQYRLFLLLALSTAAVGYVNTISVRDKHFVDSVTGEPFFIKGVDYQPGGAAQITGTSDPLSDPSKCARDIALLRDLGINTIRIYSVNPDLDHDRCMTMLASSGIYLILDVNTPLQNQHLNRYEPWTTYNSYYLEHVFKVVAKFSKYNNTLGFFAGNEVVNDEKSATHSPIYVKKLIGDIKQYISTAGIRPVPIGYSAADDLSYRVSLSQYLECDSGNFYDSVDFYGVNSYQWCGEQTIETSGYDKLIEAYRDYTKPVILSEFGCNRVLPRQFGEIDAIYSKRMSSVFSGGLVYEFSEEPNNYGLVKINTDNSVQILPDFKVLKHKYQNVTLLSAKELKEVADDYPVFKGPIPCAREYKNIEIRGKVAENIAANIIKNGVTVPKSGYLADLKRDDFESPYKIVDVDGMPWLPPEPNLKQPSSTPRTNIGNHQMSSLAVVILVTVLSIISIKLL
ncbi:1,3-beta-glucanosyltransferase GAS4 [Nakaseomyces bracarensis]|uniref:1,3-beta-glucanosyltransferase n=1 Tax=Nakaseomyces bracarensis TaxID=273131 RepID=A0ABR4NTD7_9SACH